MSDDERYNKYIVAILRYNFLIYFDRKTDADVAFVKKIIIRLDTQCTRLCLKMSIKCFVVVFDGPMF